MAETAHREAVPGSPSPVRPPAPEPSWSVLAHSGTLVLSRSTLEFVVYTPQAVFGRWPVTEEGYRHAAETFEAHRQSLAHGIAYTATGYRDPGRAGLPEEPVVRSKTYASPLSYVGSTRRIVAWARELAARSPSYAILGWCAAMVALLAVWAFLLFWYFVIFFLFGIFVIPYRLVRRSQRKSLHVQQTSLATQQAMLQQMAAQQMAAQQMAAQQMAQLQPPAWPAAHQPSRSTPSARPPPQPSIDPPPRSP